MKLTYEDSNLDKQNQNLLCYHYTIGQCHIYASQKQCKGTYFFPAYQISVKTYLWDLFFTDALEYL